MNKGAGIEKGFRCGFRAGPLSGGIASVFSNSFWLRAPKTNADKEAQTKP